MYKLINLNASSEDCVIVTGQARWQLLVAFKLQQEKTKILKLKIMITVNWNALNSTYNDKIMKTNLTSPQSFPCNYS